MRSLLVSEKYLILKVFAIQFLENNNMPRSKPTITYKKKDEIAIISMNRPEYNNAQNGKMTYDLDKAFKRAIDDDEV